jgi:hypothetical protein
MATTLKTSAPTEIKPFVRSPDGLLVGVPDTVALVLSGDTA